MGTSATLAVPQVGDVEVTEADLVVTETPREGWAVAADTGRVLWTLPNVASATGVLGSAGPAVTDRAVLFPFASGGLTAALVLIVVHGPEGFVHPMLTAILSSRVPENAQGELQGGISAITNLAMLAGTGFFAQVFGWFMREGAANPSPDMVFFVAGGGLILTLFAMIWTTRREER